MPPTAPGAPRLNTPWTGPPADPALIAADGISVAAWRALSPTAYEFDLAPDPVANTTVILDVGLAAGCAGRALDFYIRWKYGTVVPRYPIGAGSVLNVWVSQAAPWDAWTPLAPTLAGDFDAGLQRLRIRLPALPGDARRVAVIPPYTNGSLDADVALWTAGLPAGTLTATTIGTSVQGRPVTRYTVTQGGTKAIYLQRAGHPNERWRDYFMQGMLAWLCSPAGATARGRAIWHVVVRPSPDTWANGWARCNAAGIEQNRWNGSLALDGPEQWAVRQDILAIKAAQNLRTFVDLHTSGDWNGEILVYTPGSDFSQVPLATFDTQAWYKPVEAENWSGITNWSMRVAKNVLGVPHTGMIDTGGKAPQSIARMREAGTAFAQAFDAWLATH